MSYIPCATPGCPRRVCPEKSSIREGTGRYGQRFADGKTCFRCRTRAAEAAGGGSADVVTAILLRMITGKDPYDGVPDRARGPVISALKRMRAQGLLDVEATPDENRWVLTHIGQRAAEDRARAA